MSLLSRLAVQAARAYGILSSKAGVSAEYLVVAGGGGGGKTSNSGGGGAGGMLTSTATLSTLNTYSITVGAGGNGATSSNTSGSQGANSVISGTGLSTITAIGGGYGGHPAANGGNGGSGGGAGYATKTGGTGTVGQGNNGGNGNGVASAYSGGGGGGAGAAGGNGTGTVGSGVGGAGLASSISGSSVTYAGGGGAGNDTSTVQAGGSGGGGNGGAGSSTAATSGTANRGGGGGGSSSLGDGANGGSGIVIISYTSATPKFVGGTITTSGGKQIHTFTSSGTLSPITPITASYLVVAGGGGGGTGSSGGQGGGGAGGLLTNSTTLYSGATYVVTVGGGGAQGVNGSNSVVSGTGLTTLTATGGGLGASGSFGTGGSGGSGGGGSEGNNPSDGGNGGAGTSGQGSNGGKGAGGAGGGGGGAGAVGAAAAGSGGAGVVPGNGGIGVQSSISGTATYYAGGGGGSGYGPYTSGSTGTGGSGGGGTGASGQNGSLATPGTPNTGGGGGAKNTAGTGSASGGSGIVIISYAGSQQFNGGLVTTSGGNTIHTFLATGALTPLTNNLNNSLRFRSSASAYLNRTPSVTSNLTTWTWSGWVKLGALSTDRTLFGAASSGNAQLANIHIAAANSFEIDILDANSTRTIRGTTAVYRDPSAWYHVVFILDTTQATAANRMRLYINGNQISLDVAIVGTYPAQNANCIVNSTSGVHNVGRRPQSNDRYFDGYMTDINFIDGQALEPYYFGNNDANGVWKPIQYKGTYGTNGFYLTFGNTTSTTTLGYDSSPNGNNWTCNNISLTAGTTYDAMTDVPTNTSATVANYAVLNPLDKGTTVTVQNANLQATIAATHNGVRGTFQIPTSGKWYWEVTIGTTTSNSVIASFGVATNAASLNTYTYNTTGTYALYCQGSPALNYVTNGSVGTTFGSAVTGGTVCNIAYDADNGQLYLGIGNTYYSSAGAGTGNPSTATNPSMAVASSLGLFPYVHVYSETVDINFGQRPFTYTPPTGFVALNTYNLPTPTILQGNKYMDATLYTGDGASTKVIVNQAQFKPDLVWGQARSAAYGSWLFDSVRGATKQISSFSTNAESTQSTMLTAFNSNGFNMGSDTAGNQSSITYVGWQWQAGQGSTSSNTSGSITSTVSVNTTAGFSIATYTGNGSAGATIGHGLGVAPKFIIIKKRSSTADWDVYHSSLGATKALYLNRTDGQQTGTTFWNDTAPSSTLTTFGTSPDINSNGVTYVMYSWAEIAGFSKFTSYTGNGSSDGPFIYCGFRPKFVIIKMYSGAVGQSWALQDTSRSTYNASIYRLQAESSNAENSSTSNSIDILSNGFKIRTTDNEYNNSSYSYIVAAFAENPFKNANAR